MYFDAISYLVELAYIHLISKYGRILFTKFHFGIAGIIILCAVLLILCDSIDFILAEYILDNPALLDGILDRVLGYIPCSVANATILTKQYHLVKSEASLAETLLACTVYKVYSENVERSWRALRQYRHETRKRGALLKIYLSNGDSSAIRAIIQEAETVASPSFILSGHPVIDALVNIYSEDISRKCIHFKHNIRVPADMPVDDLFLMRTFGNVVSNAAIHTNVGGAIELTATYKTSGLYIKCVNTYDEESRRESKARPGDHGQGMYIMKKSIKECRGVIDIERSDETFAVTMWLPFA